MTKEYQGWSNQATWTIHLHMSNNQPYYNAVTVLVQAAAVAKHKDNSYALADSLERFVRNLMDAGYPPFLNSDRGRLVEDMFNAAMAEVNWQELAKFYLDEYSLNGR